ncbi:hypothetical protein NPIL_60171, partial [Nephila pilipes]
DAPDVRRDGLFAVHYMKNPAFTFTTSGKNGMEVLGKGFDHKRLNACLKTST